MKKGRGSSVGNIALVMDLIESLVSLNAKGGGDVSLWQVELFLINKV